MTTTWAEKAKTAFSEAAEASEAADIQGGSSSEWAAKAMEWKRIAKAWREAAAFAEWATAEAAEAEAGTPAPDKRQARKDALRRGAERSAAAWERRCPRERK